MRVFWAQVVNQAMLVSAVVIVALFGHDMPPEALATLMGLFVSAATQMKPSVESKAADTITAARIQTSMPPPKTSTPPPRTEDS